MDNLKQLLGSKRTTRDIGDLSFNHVYFVQFTDISFNPSMEDSTASVKLTKFEPVIDRSYNYYANISERFIIYDFTGISGEFNEIITTSELLDISETDVYLIYAKIENIFVVDEPSIPINTVIPLVPQGENYPIVADATLSYYVYINLTKSQMDTDYIFITKTLRGSEPEPEPPATPSDLNIPIKAHNVLWGKTLIGSGGVPDSAYYPTFTSKTRFLVDQE
jgi:hypothetical protein